MTTNVTTTSDTPCDVKWESVFFRFERLNNCINFYDIVENSVGQTFCVAAPTRQFLFCGTFKFSKNSLNTDLKKKLHKSCAETKRILMLKCHLLQRIEFQFELVNQQKHQRNCRWQKQQIYFNEKWKFYYSTCTKSFTTISFTVKMIKSVSYVVEI